MSQRRTANATRYWLLDRVRSFSEVLLAQIARVESSTLIRGCHYDGVPSARKVGDYSIKRWRFGR